MTDDGDTFSVAELVEYCRTQAGLLSGRVETIGAEADDLLDEIDADIAAIRARLDDTEGPATSPSPAGPTEPGDGIATLEELESELEEKQALAEAKQARMQAFQELAAAYVELAEELDAFEDGRTALERVIRFERERDAPAYFEERLTLLEAAAGSGAE